MKYHQLFKKRYEISKSILFIITSFFFISCDSNPQIKFLSKDLDIGELRAGESKKVNTQIKNIGQDTLIIESVSAGCHCTDVSVSNKKLPPGGEADLKLTYYASDNMRPNDIVRVGVVIRSNTKNQFDEFYINGKIK